VELPLSGAMTCDAPFEHRVGGVYDARKGVTEGLNFEPHNGVAEFSNT